MRKVVTAATIALAVVAVAGRGRAGRAPSATRVPPTPSVVMTTTRAVSTTLPAKRRIAAPTTTVTSVKTTRRGAVVSTVPGKPRATSTSKPAPPPLNRTQRLKACLGLAAANNLRTVSANRAWFQHQLGGAAARKKMPRARYNALVTEQAQLQTVIQAQYSIDVANCYIKNA